MDKKATEIYGFDWLRNWMMRYFWVFMYFEAGLVFPSRKQQAMAVAAQCRNHRITFSGTKGAKMYHANVYRGYNL